MLQQRENPGAPNLGQTNPSGLAASACRRKRLLIADFDGTVTDMVGSLRQLTERAFENIRALQLSRNPDDTLEWDKFIRAIKHDDMPPEYRFHDFERLMYRLRLPGGLLGHYADDASFRKTCDAIVADFRQQQRDIVRPFEGAVETLRALRDAGHDVAIWSDAPAMSLFERIWIMNARMPFFRETEDGKAQSLVDAIYVPLRGNEHSDEPLLNGFGPESDFKKKLLAMTRYLPLREFKPSGAHINRIMQDFGRSAAETVMIGDSLEKDGGSAFAAGVDFAFFQPGAEITRCNADFYRQFQVAHDKQELPVTARENTSGKGSQTETPYQAVQSWNGLLQSYDWGLDAKSPPQLEKDRPGPRSLFPWRTPQAER